MRETAFLWQKPSEESSLPSGLPDPTREFSTTDDFKVHARALLTEWIAAASA